MRLFRSRMFSIGLSVNVLIGLGMFGALATLPLYLQIVKGATPDRVRPAAAADDGRHHGRLDRVRPAHLPDRPLQDLPGDRHRRCWRSRCFLLLTVDVDTPLLAARPATVLLFGLGLGLCMQTLVLAVQNAVPAAGHGRGHLVGDVLPPDGRHARHRGVPVGAVQLPAGQGPGACSRPARPRRSSRPSARLRPIRTARVTRSRRT